MNTKISGKNVASPRGEIFYDADCTLCSRGVMRWGGVFERRGFRWLPLQTAGDTVLSGANNAELLQEMKLRLADGRLRGGVDAWAVLFCSVWWLWPIGVLIGLPGIRFLSAAIYRWIARNRYCLSGACGLRDPLPAHHRHAAFLKCRDNKEHKGS